MKRTVIAIIACLGLCLAFSGAFAGEAVFFDADGNRITEAQYNAMAQKAREEKAARQEALRSMEEAKARERAAQREAQRAKAAAAAAQAQAGSQSTPATPASRDSTAIIDRMIQSHQTGAASVAPPATSLNTFDCYTYQEMFDAVEDMYVENIRGRSVIKIALIDGVWRKVDSCQEDKFRIGKRLPDLKEVTWTWNKLNKKKTGKYRGD